jgi:hypothetical protein
MIKNKNRYIIKKYKIMLNKHYPYSSKFTITRKHIYELFNDFDYKVGAELGVLRGTNARSICQSVPDVKLFCIDPWNGGPVYQHYYKRARQKLRRFNVDFMRMTSMQAVSKFDTITNHTAASFALSIIIRPRTPYNPFL